MWQVCVHHLFSLFCGIGCPWNHLGDKMTRNTSVAPKKLDPFIWLLKNPPLDYQVKCNCIGVFFQWLSAIYPATLNLWSCCRSGFADATIQIKCCESSTMVPLGRKCSDPKFLWTRCLWVQKVQTSSLTYGKVWVSLMVSLMVSSPLTLQS